MCVLDIIEFIDEFHNGLCKNKIANNYFYLKKDKKIDTIEKNLIETLNEHYSEDKTFKLFYNELYKIIYNKKFIIYTLIKDTTHIITIEEDENVIYWKVLIISEDR